MSQDTTESQSNETFKTLFIWNTENFQFWEKDSLSYIGSIYSHKQLGLTEKSNTCMYTVHCAVIQYSCNKKKGNTVFFKYS